jgi:hypothetical protein
MPIPKWLMHAMQTRLGLLAPLVTALSLGGLMAGCAVVKPAERGLLAEPCMESPFDGKRPLRAYENKVLQTLSGSELPAGAPGGGCGCVN